MTLMGEPAAVDLLVIGAGVNGAGIARDAAGRGLSVLLCDKADIANGTSSRSGKLVHGGLRYLEYYELRLVREALKEREVLLANAPHIIWPMRFVLPHDETLRPAWMIRAGLFLYDHLGGRRRLPASRALDLSAAPEGEPLQARYRKGFEYPDCWVDDARLVILNAKAAAAHGAEVLPHTACTTARRSGGLWQVTLQHGDGGRRCVYARALVNAAGPWVDRVLQEVIGRRGSKRVRLVKGSHIIVPKFYRGDQAYLFQNVDRRVIFVNPYEGNHLLIGTTDIAFDDSPDRVEVDPDEIGYLCAAVNRYFRRSIGPNDVVHAFSGVRPLYDDAEENPSAVTRDYVLDIGDDAGRAPLLSVFGGKITTYRRLAEHALDRLRRYFPGMGPAWTARSPLPGGDMPKADFEAYVRILSERFDWLPGEVLHHYARCYGTLAERLLEGAHNMDALGRHFGAGLYERELRYLMAEEWARTTEDILWRRTKLGLHLDKTQAAAVEAWVAEQAPPRRGEARQGVS